MGRNSEVTINVELDEKNMPAKILWQATDAPFSGSKEAKTMLLSFWDKDDGVSLSLDLWTKEMTIDEMNIHFYQTLLKMSETYRKATRDEKTSSLIKNFAESFSKHLHLNDKFNKRNK
ncbi:MAG: gliding motility protein GldC [Ignavibacteriaceae bacterium]